MRLVVDVNVLFSALIKAGASRRILLLLEHDLFAPEFTVEEFGKHLPELQKKTGLPGEKVAKNFETILRLAEIKLIPFEDFRDKRALAAEVSPDADDVAYFALALHLQCPLWTQDKELKKQTAVKVVTTGELFG